MALLLGLNALGDVERGVGITELGDLRVPRRDYRLMVLRNRGVVDEIGENAELKSTARMTDGIHDGLVEWLQGAVVQCRISFEMGRCTLQHYKKI